MFSDLQRLFQKSVAAFRAELGKREPEDQVVELLTAMRRELVAARASLKELDGQVHEARAELRREQELLAQCERRGDLAGRIGDEETVRVAAEFAARHRERVQVLETKARALASEQALRQREAEEMLRKYQEADANRFALLSRLRRVQTGERLRSALDGTADSFAAWDRMEERVADQAAYTDALEELTEAAPPPRQPGVEERLRELKRQMGKD